VKYQCSYVPKKTFQNNGMRTPLLGVYSPKHWQSSLVGTTHTHTHTHTHTASASPSHQHAKRIIRVTKNPSTTEALTTNLIRSPNHNLKSDTLRQHRKAFSGAAILFFRDSESPGNWKIFGSQQRAIEKLFSRAFQPTPKRYLQKSEQIC
jgi:hypothetical protein